MNLPDARKPMLSSIAVLSEAKAETLRGFREWAQEQDMADGGAAALRSAVEATARVSLGCARRSFPGDLMLLVGRNVKNSFPLQGGEGGIQRCYILLRRDYRGLACGEPRGQFCRLSPTPMIQILVEDDPSSPATSRLQLRAATKGDGDARCGPLNVWALACAVHRPPPGIAVIAVSPL